MQNTHACMHLPTLIIIMLWDEVLLLCQHRALGRYVCEGAVSCVWCGWSHCVWCGWCHCVCYVYACSGATLGLPMNRNQHAALNRSLNSRGVYCWSCICDLQPIKPVMYITALQRLVKCAIIKLLLHSILYSDSIITIQISPAISKVKL